MQRSDNRFNGERTRDEYWYRKRAKLIELYEGILGVLVFLGIYRRSLYDWARLSNFLLNLIDPIVADVETLLIINILEYIFFNINSLRFLFCKDLTSSILFIRLITISYVNKRR